MEETDRQEVLSKLIQKLVNEKREPYLFIRIFNEEAFEKIIPFKRKSSKEVPFLEYTFYNTTTKKSETVDFYNYQLHLEKYGFKWAYAELKFLNTMKRSTDKKILIRKMTMGKETRKKHFLDESRVWNISLRTINREKSNFIYVWIFIHRQGNRKDIPK